jgi:hypothetical protein
MTPHDHVVSLFRNLSGRGFPCSKGLATFDGWEEPALLHPAFRREEVVAAAVAAGIDASRLVTVPLAAPVAGLDAATVINP